MQTIKGNKIGIGLRHPHYQQMLEEKPEIDLLDFPLTKDAIDLQLTPCYVLFTRQ